MTKLIKKDEYLKQLSTFKIRRLWIENWYVTKESFKIHAKSILFEGWIFGKTLNIKNIEYWTNHNIQLEFRDWKYGECSGDTFTLDSFDNVIDYGFANFMIDFINIQYLAKYLDQIKIDNSFGIIELTI